jgi:DNA-directed RNA polymerase subunit K
MEKQKFSRYEMSRILGARALQIAMNAPLLVKIDKKELEAIHFDPLKIAEIEFNSGILPIEVNKPLPLKREDKLKRTKDQQISDKKVEEAEEEVEEEMEKEGEMMELANPDDEMEEDEGSSDSREE